MTSNLKKAMIATLTAATMSMGATTANAQGGMNALASFEASKSVEQVQFRGRGRAFRGGRNFRGRGFGRRGFRGRNIAFGVGAGIASGIIVGSLIHSNRRHRGYHSGGHRFNGNSALRSHVAWCAKRYKTYNARTDTFISYRHGKKRCNSPYT